MVKPYESVPLNRTQGLRLGFMLIAAIPRDLDLVTSRLMMWNAPRSSIKRVTN